MKKIIQLCVGLLIGILLLWFLLRGTSWRELSESLRNVNVTWFLLAQIPVALSFFVRVQRWAYIVRAVKPDATYRSMFSATQIGFLANFTVPGRAGEFLRAFVLGRLSNIQFSKSMALVVVDRVMDVVGMIAVMLVAGMGFRLTQDIPIPAELSPNGQEFTVSASVIRKTMLLTGVVAPAILVVVLLFLYLKKDLVAKLASKAVGLFSRRLAGKVSEQVVHFADGLHVFRSAADMAKSMFYNFLTWACCLVAIWFYLNAFGVECYWYSPFVIQFFLVVLISIPVAPTLMGQFHFAIVAPLCVLYPDMNYTDMLAIAIVLHLSNIIAVAATGIYCLVREKLGLVDLFKKAFPSKK